MIANTNDLGDIDVTDGAEQECVALLFKHVCVVSRTQLMNKSIKLGKVKRSHHSRLDTNYSAESI